MLSLIVSALLLDCLEAKAPDLDEYDGLYCFARRNGLKVDKLSQTPFYRLRGGKLRLTLNPGSKLIVVNGEVKKLSRAPVLYKGSVYVPVELRKYLRTAPPAIVSKPRRRLVVIDPGHGGRDPGAVGRYLKEKDVNLWIALELGRILKAHRFDVIYTRTDDTFLPLDERAMIANKAGADLFVCIHTNASRARGARGFELYYVDGKHSPLERAEWLSGLSIPSRYRCQGESNPIIRRILYAILLEESRTESRKLANSTKLTLSRVCLSRNPAIREGPWRVLRLTAMPHIFVEVGFISNSLDERLLASRNYRRRLAEAIAQGLLNALR